jgi:hypothetical protein
MNIPIYNFLWKKLIFLLGNNKLIFLPAYSLINLSFIDFASYFIVLFVMQYLDELVDLYFDLLEYCGAKENFLQKEFKKKLDFYSKKYSRLEQDEQGYIAEQINVRYKR